MRAHLKENYLILSGLAFSFFMAMGWTNKPEPFTSVLCSSCQLHPKPSFCAIEFHLGFPHSSSWGLWVFPLSLIDWSCFLFEKLLNTAPHSVLSSLMKTGSRLRNDPSGIVAAAQELSGNLFSAFPTSGLPEKSTIWAFSCASVVWSHL